MGLPRPPPSPVEDDLESTAELPALGFASPEATPGDPLAATDQWVELAPQEPEPAADSGPRDLAATLRAAEGLLERQRERVAELEQERDRLHEDLQPLREMLATRAAILEQREAALAEAHAATAAAEARAAQGDQRQAALEREVGELRRRTTVYLEALQSNLGRRDVYESACAALDARIAELEAELAANGARIRILEAALAERDAGLVRAAERAEAQARASEAAAAALEHAEVLQLELREKDARLQALEERDAKLRELESDAAARVVALGDLQQSIQRIDFLTQSGADVMPQGPKRLLIRSDGGSEVVHVLGRRTTIGRTPDNDLQIDTKYVSRHHAVLLAGPVQTIIEDLGSTNGVRVNDRRIQRRALKDGDRVLIGKTGFRFVVRPTDASS